MSARGASSRAGSLAETLAFVQAVGAKRVSYAALLRACQREVAREDMCEVVGRLEIANMVSWGSIARHKSNRSTRRILGRGSSSWRLSRASREHAQSLLELAETLEPSER